MKYINKFLGAIIVFAVLILTLSCHIIFTPHSVFLRVHEPNFVGDFRHLNWLPPHFNVIRTELRISIDPRGADFRDPPIVVSERIFLDGETLTFYEWRDRDFSSSLTRNDDILLGGVRIYLRQATGRTPIFDYYAWWHNFLITEIFESTTRLRPYGLNSVNLTIDRSVGRRPVTIFYNVDRGVMYVRGTPFENPAAQNDVNFIAVGGSGFMAHSADGASWTPMRVGPDHPSTPPWLAISYGNDKFVAVGDGKMAHSADGTTWTISPTWGVTGIWNDVIYANGMFVAVGNDGRIAHSIDGFTWSLLSMGSENWGGVAFGNGRFVAVGSNGTTAISNINMNWSPRIVGTEHWSDVIFVNGRFIAVGTNGTMAHSTDGINWTPSNVGSANWFSITFGIGRFVVVGSNGAIAHSTDGINWIQTGMGFGNWFGVAFSNNRFVAVGANGSMAHSANGSSWTPINVGTTTWFGITPGG